jgi:ABC-type cobalamin/Fe3+-siderophores transport system ATPase subunit
MQFDARTNTGMGTMKLLRAQVTNYRSVEDSDEFRIDQVTSLVGKNEAGKSAILQALASLNPHPATNIVLNKERDYPSRFLTSYEERHGGKEAVAVTTHWLLDDDEVGLIERELGPLALQSREVRIVRKYESKAPTWQFFLNTAKVCEHLFSRFGLDATERALLKAAADKGDPVSKLEAIAERSDKQTALLTHLKPLPHFQQLAYDVLQERLPRFMYFASYDRMDGQVHVQTVLELVKNGQIDRDEHRGKKLFR